MGIFDKTSVEVGKGKEQPSVPKKKVEGGVEVGPKAFKEYSPDEKEVLRRAIKDTVQGIEGQTTQAIPQGLSSQGEVINRTLGHGERPPHAQMLAEALSDPAKFEELIKKSGGLESAVNKINEIAGNSEHRQN